MLIYDMNLCDAFSFSLTLLWASGSFIMLHQLSPSSEVPIHWLKLQKKMPNARVHASAVANNKQQTAPAGLQQSQWRDLRYDEAEVKLKKNQGESSEKWVLSNFSHLSGVKNTFCLERMAVCVYTAMS